MDTLMFINQLSGVNMCFVARDDSQYGKFMCVYTTSGTPRTYKQHQKHGFESPAEAIAWYLNRFPDGNVVSQENFLNLQGQLLTLKMPKQPSVFNPTFMTEKSRPVAAKKDSSGKIISDFE